MATCLTNIKTCTSMGWLEIPIIANDKETMEASRLLHVQHVEKALPEEVISPVMVGGSRMSLLCRLTCIRAYTQRRQATRLSRKGMQ